MRNFLANLIVVILLVVFVIAIFQAFSCRQPPEITREPFPASCCKDAGAEVGGTAAPVPAVPVVATPQFGSVLVVVKIDDQEYAAVCGGEVSFIPVESAGRQLLKLKRDP